jgi:sarcosine oxidase subunit beta
VAVQTSRGEIACGRVAMAAAGHSGVIAAMAGVRLPITTYALQAFVSEPVKPVLDRTVISGDTGIYLSQSEKGELVVGQGLDLYPSYAQRGNIPVIEEAVAALLDLFPNFSRLRLMRQWAGAVDVTTDSSPIIGKTPVDNLYVNCGFGTGGFKAIPAGGVSFAATVADDRPHPLVRSFDLERFYTGRMIDEAAAAGIAH